MRLLRLLALLLCPLLACARQSACETGLGKAHAGGTIGLARAFEIAGARNVLMSLWEISDGQTPELMALFTRYLVNEGKGQTYFPYEALRRAVREYKKKQPDPYFWAAFSMFGVPI
ncbi:MAG: CHAT domain-containing protein [Chitinophagaceae bacterium]|nr:MAG: CHAT domain-containing protein [Chitinophagaceae bacterium]